MWRASHVVLATVAGGGGAGGKLPSPASSLLNPRSQRAKTRKAISIHHAQQAHFNDQAMFADIGGSGDAGVKRRGARRRLASSSGHRVACTSSLQTPPKNKAQRKSFHVRKVGRTIAEKAQYMTDSEWESVSMDDKHAFTKYMSQTLKTHPTTVSEQQRRRYFETTMMDPRDLDPNTTVRDEYERIKLGLSVQIKNPQRSLGVSQAIYETGEASLFDPDNVHALENAMTDVKQVFADYVRKRREGISTEAERRRLANLTADLNVETQKHLSHLFKYSEERVRTIAREERKQQLEEIQRLRHLAVARTRQTTEAAQPAEQVSAAASSTLDPPFVAATAPSSSPASLPASEAPRRSPVTSRRAALKASISKAIGLDVGVVDSILTEMEAQEQFYQFCEVFARLTVGKGFEHSRTDEGLDAYTESLKKLYSVDATALSTLDVVQYFAAKDEASPVEWARRWYEKAVMVPLEKTPEYQRLKAIQEADLAALKLRKDAETVVAAAQEANASLLLPSSSPSPPSEGTEASAQPENTAAVDTARVREQGAARFKTAQVTNIVEKMFMRPDDARLQTVHERRLRYLAYLQMERQIEKARENAAHFAGLENTAEAAECRGWYQGILERKAILEAQRHPEAPAADSEVPSSSSTSSPDEATSTSLATTRHGDAHVTSTLNIFEEDPEAAALFEKIRDVSVRVIQQERSHRRASEAAAKAAQVRAALKDALGGDAMEAAQAFQHALAEKKKATAQRLLGIMERDVTSEVQWLEEMEEADRPALLPVPEGMSYVSAAEVQAWKDVRDASEREAGDPFKKKQTKAGQSGLQASLFGQPWRIPDKPMLFWGTGTKAVQQALQFAAEDAERRRRGMPLAPPYPCPENPWGWRLVKDILDE